MKPKIPKKVIAATKKGKVPRGYHLYLLGTDFLDPMAHVLLLDDAYWVEDFQGEKWHAWGISYPGEYTHYLVILSTHPSQGGLVLLVGNLHEAADYLQDRYEYAGMVMSPSLLSRRHNFNIKDRHKWAGLAVGLRRVAGNFETAITGRYGISSTGHYGTSAAGDHGTATTGYKGTATAGDYGTATAGDHGTAIVGVHGTATAGYSGTAIAGYPRPTSVRKGGTATAGAYGTAIVGERGIATVGVHGTVSAGRGSTVQIAYYSGHRHCVKRWYVYNSEDGLRPHVKYKLNENHEFEEVK